MKIRSRLLATTLLISILPITIVGGLSLWESHQALSHQAFKHLESVRQIKKQQIESFFAERREDMQVLIHVVSLLEQKAQQRLSSIQANKIAQLQAFFQERLRNIAVLSKDEWVGQALEQFDSALKMEQGVGGLAWTSIEGRLGESLKKIQDEYDYFDLILIAKEGDVVYSTRKGADLGKNILTEASTSNPLYRAFDKGLKRTSIEDFAFYEDADHQYISFVSAPLYRFEELSGVLVLALTLDSQAPASINNILQRREGLGDTGESYLVGRVDNKITYRNPRTIPLNPSVPGDVATGIDVMQGFEGKSQSMVKMTKDKLLKLTSYAPLPIPGLDWVLISQINLEEAITPRLHKNEADFFSQYIKHYDYHDLLLVHPKGQVFYSVAKEDDYGSNLFYEEYSHTHLAKLIQKVRDTGHLKVSDYALYAPSNNEPVAFIAQPLVSEEGEIELIVVLQLHDNSLSSIMDQREGMGETGESYLVGQDHLMRSNSFLDTAQRTMQASLNDPKNGSVKTSSVMAALRGDTGEQISTNYLEQAVLSAYTPLKLNDQQWALITEINKQEAFAEIYELQILMAFIMTLIVLISWWLSADFTRQLSTPLLRIRKRLRSLSQGEVMTTSLEYHGHDEIAEIATATEQLGHALRSVIQQAKDITAGDFNNEVALLSDKDELGHALTTMITTLRGVVMQANLIAQGDYSREVQVRSDNDQLGLALADMTHTLRQMHESNTSALSTLEQENAQKNREDWFKTGMGELGECMSGQQDTAILGKNIIGFLAKYLNAQIGTFYLLIENDIHRNTGRLKLIASYAYTRRKSASQEFVLGEGLVGQAALENQLIVITSVPTEYIQIQSSVGDAPPHNLVIVPFSYEEQLSGVFELGRFEAFSDDELNFLKQVTTSVGIAVNTAESRVRMQELLEQSRAQAEELQSQSEELQSQQEELRQSNEELEARSNDLESQKEAIRSKNAALQDSQKSIEAKAEELELASKYKSEFLANMSHELRTPLNSMLILSQMLMENKHSNLTEQQVESARTIHHAGADLLNLINDILDLSKVEAGKIQIHLEDFPLSTLSDALTRNFQPMAENKGLNFSIESALSNEFILHTDLQRLRQIVTNLLSNAFKFTEKDGAVILTISQPNAQNISFAVTDSGIGISTEKQKSIFEAFHQADGTTSRRYGGTGLGLSISRQLTKLLQGTLSLESEAGEGSTFTLTVPMYLQKVAGSESSATPVSRLPTPQTPATPSSPPPVSLPTPIPTPAPPVASHAAAETTTTAETVSPKPLPSTICQDDREQLQADDKTLLIVEDDEKFAQILLDLARERGFKVLCANDGENGLQLAQEYRPSAIVLDVGLPRIDGWTVMDKLKHDSELRHIPVHFVSGTDDHADALRMGAIGYLLKPVSMTELGGAFKTIENFIQKDLKQLLLVADDSEHRQQILELLQSEEAQAITAPNKAEAWDLLQQNLHTYDCIVLDVSTEQDTGIELLNDLRQQDHLRQIPVIIYAERELSQYEEQLLESSMDQLTVKSVRSPERLLDEATLFLHQVEAKLPENKRLMLNRVHDKEALFQGKKILLADDDMRNVFALGGSLESKGMTVILAQDGEEAITQLQENPDVDLILMDVMMPNIDGYEAMRRIRAERRFKKLPIIALTAKAMKNDRAKCIEAGASDYLSKPLDVDKLLSLMRVWLYQ